MKVSALAPNELADRLWDEGLRIRTGPFTVHLCSRLPQIARGIAVLYTDFDLSDGPFADFHVHVETPRNLRRWYRPQVVFSFDGQQPFRPLALTQALPVFEWGVNWCIANHAHQFLIIHAAVIERDGLAVVMPAPPGSGKSTLCAGLVSRGWRLLSDELALISTSGHVVPLPRPVSLKNESIDIIRRFAPDATIGPLSRDTHKGTVAHMKPPPESIACSAEPALPACIVFPKFQPGAGAALQYRRKGQTLLQLAENTFNYNVLGARGFKLLANLVDRCECYDFGYSRLDEAVGIFAALLEEARDAGSRDEDGRESKTCGACAV